MNTYARNQQSKQAASEAETILKKENERNEYHKRRNVGGTGETERQEDEEAQAALRQLLTVQRNARMMTMMAIPGQSSGVCPFRVLNPRPPRRVLVSTARCVLDPS